MSVWGIIVILSFAILRSSFTWLLCGSAIFSRAQVLIWHQTEQHWILSLQYWKHEPLSLSISDMKMMLALCVHLVLQSPAAHRHWTRRRYRILLQFLTTLTGFLLRFISWFGFYKNALWDKHLEHCTNTNPMYSFIRQGLTADRLSVYRRSNGPGLGSSLEYYGTVLCFTYRFKRRVRYQRQITRCTKTPC